MIAQHASLLRNSWVRTRIMRPVTVTLVCHRPSHGDGGPGSNNDRAGGKDMPVIQIWATHWQAGRAELQRH